MATEKRNVISITGVMIQDKNTAGYTAYFAEFPEVIAQGGNADEVKSNLFDALQSVLSFRREEMEDENEGDEGVYTESFELSVN